MTNVRAKHHDLATRGRSWQARTARARAMIAHLVRSEGPEQYYLAAEEAPVMADDGELVWRPALLRERLRRTFLGMTDPAQACELIDRFLATRPPLPPHAVVALVDSLFSREP